MRIILFAFSDFEGDDKNRPLQAKSYLNQRQIEAVVDFIMNDLQGQKVSKDYCIKLWAFQKDIFKKDYFVWGCALPNGMLKTY